MHLMKWTEKRFKSWLMVSDFPFGPFDIDYTFLHPETKSYTLYTNGCIFLPKFDPDNDHGLLYLSYFENGPLKPGYLKQDSKNNT